VSNCEEKKKGKVDPKTKDDENHGACCTKTKFGAIENWRETLVHQATTYSNCNLGVLASVSFRGFFVRQSVDQ